MGAAAAGAVGGPAAPGGSGALCRLCLSARGDTRPIFSQASAGSRLKERILACVHVQIDEDDGLPAQICKKCIGNVNNWHVFKKICEESQAKLRDWANGDVTADQLEVKIKKEPTSEEEDFAIDASYPGVESIEENARDKLQPEGPPILASLGLAPRNEKESDEENYYGNEASPAEKAAVGKENVGHRTVAVEQLASKDCLVCGRAYRYSHNARRHERVAHAYDRYTNTIDPSTVCIKNTPFKTKTNTENDIIKNNYRKPSQEGDYLTNYNQAEILKSLLTAKMENETSDSDSRSDSSESVASDEPDISSYQVETILSVPKNYSDDSSDDENDHEMGMRGGIGSEVEVNINSELDINRIIGIEEEDDDEPIDGQQPELIEDVPPIADNVEVDNISEIDRPTVPDCDSKLESEEESQDEDDDDMQVPLVPIIEINENPLRHDLDESGDDESDNESCERIETSVVDSLHNELITITPAQKVFIEKHRDLIEQINTMKCKCCDKNFPRRKAVIQHLQKNGRKIPKHTCYTCVIPFSHIGALLSHMRYNCCNDTWKLIYREGGIPDNMVIDDNADMIDNIDENLKSQYKDILNARTYVCKLCSAKYRLKQFIMKHIFDAHESAATQVQPLTCFHCKYKFMDNRLWKKHLRNGECTVLIDCDMCSAKFESMKDFNDHAIADHADDFVNQEKEFRITDGRPTNCPICAKNLSNYHNLVKHLKMVHNEEKPHLCQYCDTRFEQISELNHHIYIDHDDKFPNGDDMEYNDKDEVTVYNYSCTECDAVFESVELWTEHQISVHHHVAYECDRCEKKFWDEMELEEHKAVHFKNKIYKCTHCSNSFSSSQNLAEHMTQYHRLSSAPDRSYESQFYCEICIRSFKSRQAFSNHMRIHAKVPTTNRRAGEIKRSMSDSPHQNKAVRIQSQNNKVIRHVDPAPYSCDICGKGFLHKKNIWKHKKMLHPEVVNKTKEVSNLRNVSTEEEDYTNDDQRLSIPQFDSFAAMYDQPENSGSEGALLYQCDLCDKRFAVKSSIWKHKRVKHGVMNPQQDLPIKTEIKTEPVKEKENARLIPLPTSCTICKIVFNDKRAYYRHRKMMHSNRNQSNSSSDHLENQVKDTVILNGKSQKKLSAHRMQNSSDEDDVPHHQNHRREVKYPCDTCGKNFHEAVTLQNHTCLQRTPIAETYECEICNKSYTSISALKSHRGWHLRSPDGRAAFSNSGLWMPQNKVTNKVSKHEVIESLRLKAPAQKEISPLHIKRKLPPDVQVTLLKKRKDNEDVSITPVQSVISQVDPIVRQLAIKEERYCEPCAKTFTKKAAYQRHIEEVHKHSNVVCPICKKSFTRKSTLLVHMRKHDTGNISEPPDMDESDDDDDMDEDIPDIKPPIYRCEICNMQHTSSKSLRRHRLKYHGGSVQRPQAPRSDDRTIKQGVVKEYKCGLCEDEFDTEMQVLSHSHYQCTFCGLYFSQNQNLMAHTKTRHSDKSHTIIPCNKCNRLYMNKKSLQKHIELVHSS